MRKTGSYFRSREYDSSCLICCRSWRRRTVAAKKNSQWNYNSLEQGRSNLPCRKREGVSPHSPQNMTKLRKTAQNNKGVTWPVSAAYDWLKAHVAHPLTRILLDAGPRNYERTPCLRVSYWLRALEIPAARPFSTPIGQGDQLGARTHFQPSCISSQTSTVITSYT